MDTIPPEIMTVIFKYVDNNSLYNLSMTSAQLAPYVHEEAKKRQKSLPIRFTSLARLSGNIRRGVIRALEPNLLDIDEVSYFHLVVVMPHDVRMAGLFIGMSFVLHAWALDNINRLVDQSERILKLGIGKQEKNIAKRERWYLEYENVEQLVEAIHPKIQGKE